MRKPTSAQAALTQGALRRSTVRMVITRMRQAEHEIVCLAERLLHECIVGDPRAYLIGKGGFADVYRVQLTDGREVAMKEFRSNVMIKDGSAMVVDLGLAAPILITDTSPNGRADKVLGRTNNYAAPERFVQMPGADGKRDSIGVKADVYSFALLMSFMWTGKVSQPEAF
ncbi:hypothetical protein WJX74_006250 [Apatococcus lobatus]|uniref:Protein kinase domain-containing protein n=1 Tax=Apatococcus lobatus TaxID=904363 RepID=A0AAW1RHB9_9CHLO